MSKWDEYQDFTTTAGKVGGVKALLGIIENNAVSKAAPSIFSKGAGAGAAGATVLGAVGYVVKRLLDKRKFDQAQADEAKAQLIALADREEGEVDPGTGTDLH